MMDDYNISLYDLIPYNLLIFGTGIWASLYIKIYAQFNPSWSIDGCVLFCYYDTTCIDQMANNWVRYNVI